MTHALHVATALLMLATPACADSLKMQIEGKDWASTVVNTATMPMGEQQVITMSGKLEGTKTSLLSLQLAPTSLDDPKGHYELKSGIPKKGGGGGTFNVDLVGGDPMTDSFRFQSGMVDITAYDAATKTLTGTFSGVAVTHDGSKKATIQNGVIDAVTIGP